MIRIFIAGGPRTGKTTMALDLKRKLGVPVVHCDDHMGRGWSAASLHIANLMVADESMIIEGVAVPRALRKFMAAHPERKPCDQLIVLHYPHLELTPGQVTMTKGVETVLAGIRPELERRGVEIVEIVPPPVSVLG